MIVTDAAQGAVRGKGTPIGKLGKYVRWIRKASDEDGMWSDNARDIRSYCKHYAQERRGRYEGK